jgi:RNA polymerase sigma factor (sigma-70 family)
VPVGNFLPMSEDEPRPVPADQPAHFIHRSADRAASLVAMRADWIDFYDTEYNQVVRFVMRIGACLDDADDAAQQAFAESWALMINHPDRWTGVRDRRAWIRTLAWRKHQRPPGPRRQPLVVDGAPVPDIVDAGPNPAELTAQTLLVLQALRCLDEQPRLVMAFHLDDVPTRVIAAELNVTEQRVRDLLKNARATLKRMRASTTATIDEGRRPR